MSSFTFGNLTDQSILAFDHKCLLVATPEGTPSPPELTSTVARPLASKKVSSFRDKLADNDVDDNDASYVQPHVAKKIQFQIGTSDDSFVSPVSRQLSVPRGANPIRLLFGVYLLSIIS